jgi:protein SERAC1
MAFRRKSTVFRVTGLIRDQPDEILKTSLRATIDKHLSDDEKSQIETEIAIVPSCYESDRERMALVQFRGGAPAFLLELINNPLGEWQLEMGDDDINIDCHFFGFTQLYMPEEKEPVIAE